MASTIRVEGVFKQDIKILEPEDAGFEEAARKYGLWMPSGFEEDGTFFETTELMPTDDEDFEETLNLVLTDGLYATVQVPKE